MYAIYIYSIIPYYLSLYMVDVNWFEVYYVYKPPKMTEGCFCEGMAGDLARQIQGYVGYTSGRVFEDRVYPPNSKLISVNWSKLIIVTWDK